MSVGLVLEGGGMRGLYTAGVLDAMLDKELSVDGMVTVSAGALYGINYPSKQRGRSIRYNKKYINDKRYISMRSLFKTGNIVNKEFSFYTLPFELDVFDEEAFEKSGIDFYATVTNIHTGKPEYIKIENAQKQIEALRASGSMPFVSKPVEYNGKYYLDGGVSDSIPIRYAKQLDYDKIIVILTQPSNYRKSPANEKLINIAYKKRYPKLAESIKYRYLDYNHSLKYISKLEENGEIFVIRPSQPLNVKRLERNPDRLQRTYDLGIHEGYTIFPELKSFLEK